MKIKLFISIMVAIFGFTTIAQAQDDNNRFEFYGGYSYLLADTGLDETFDDSDLESEFNAHGFNASVTGNVNRYVGVKFDYSFHTVSRNFVEGAENFSASLRTNQFLGGVQLKDNRKEGSRVRPFGHVLAGLANQNLSASGTFIDDTTTPPTVVTIDESVSSNNFAMVVGGGIDLKVHPRVDIRLIQVDYNPIFFRDQVFDDLNIQGRTQNNFRFGFGVVFH